MTKNYDNLLLFEDEEYEVEYDDIVTSVISSLKCRAVDYCYTRKDMTAIFNEAKKQNLSMFYQEYLEKDGSLDYFKVVPARFYAYNNNQTILLSGQCYKIQDIPIELRCTITKKGHTYVFKDFNEPVKL